VVNRIADLAFTVGVLAAFYSFQSVSFSVVFGAVPYLLGVTLVFFTRFANAVTLVAVMLFLGARGKSAQIGLHT